MFIDRKSVCNICFVFKSKNAKQYLVLVPEWDTLLLFIVICCSKMILKPEDSYEIFNFKNTQYSTVILLISLSFL